MALLHRLNHEEIAVVIAFRSMTAASYPIHQPRLYRWGRGRLDNILAEQPARYNQRACGSTCGSLRQSPSRWHSLDRRSFWSSAPRRARRTMRQRRRRRVAITRPPLVRTSAPCPRLAATITAGLRFPLQLSVSSMFERPHSMRSIWTSSSVPQFPPAHRLAYCRQTVRLAHRRRCTAAHFPSGFRNTPALQ
jgi:hypothetical protein